MRTDKMLLRAFGVERAVVQGAHWERYRGRQTLVLHVRPYRCEERRCSKCGRRCPRYDRGSGPRRWRCLDVGLCAAYLQAEAPRVRCPEHGVVVQRVPWARPGARFTRLFEDLVAWLAVRTDRSTCSRLLNIAWATVGRILQRVAHSAEQQRNPLQGLRRIGIDEVSFRKGQRYLTVVVDHDSGRLLWAAEGRNEQTVRQFFELLGPERSARIQLVSADAASWIRKVVRERCPNAKLCLDPFHVVQWATEALDEVRRSVWNQLRRSGQHERAKTLKNARWALWKNPELLTEPQRATLASIERDNKPLFRAYLLKEQLRSVFQQPEPADAAAILDKWTAWASRSRLAPFVRLARTIRRHREAIEQVLRHRLSNARIEAMNTKIRLLTRLAFGFHSPKPLIALAMLKLGGLCPPLPLRP